MCGPARARRLASSHTARLTGSKPLASDATSILGALAGRHYAGIIAALAIGDQVRYRPTSGDLHAAASIPHEHSGLHVTMVATLAYVLAAVLWRVSARARHETPARNLPRCGVLPHS